MAQVSAASTAGVDDDDIGARIARLGLPRTPNVIGKTSSLANCNHQGRCYCNVYTTMLDRGPELPNIPDSPDRDNIWRDERRPASSAPRGNVRSTTTSGGLTNGVAKSAPGKKISLNQYATNKRVAATGLSQRESKSPAHGEKRLEIIMNFLKRFSDKLTASVGPLNELHLMRHQIRKGTGEKMLGKAD